MADSERVGIGQRPVSQKVWRERIGAQLPTDATKAHEWGTAIVGAPPLYLPGY